MLRVAYTLCFYLALPWVLLRLLWRALKAPAYAERWRERFGFGARLPQAASLRIWIHSVSVGETLAALPMMRALQARGYELVVTTMTPTGSERVKAALGDSVHHVYAPYDLPDCLGRFLRRTQPQLAIIMETELWPNTLRACARRQIPVLVANARLSERSARGYRKVAGLSRSMMNDIACIAAQSQADGERFVSLGLKPERLQITGNIKFDLTLDDAVQSRCKTIAHRWQGSGERLVWLAASTHSGEDEIALLAFAKVLKCVPDALLVLVPRHPERFESVYQLAARSFVVQRHSDGGAVDAATQVVIGDTMGELMALLGAADVVQMGGTLVENGGHNFIEPAAWGKPIVSGHSLFNFAEVSRMLLDAEALTRVSGADELAQVMGTLLTSKTLRKRQGKAAKTVADANRGALQRLLQTIEQMLHP